MRILPSSLEGIRRDRGGAAPCGELGLAGRSESTNLGDKAEDFELVGERMGVVCDAALERDPRSRTVLRLSLAAHSPTGGDFYPDDLLSPIIVLSIKQEL